jgi:SHS2 domain-containing protein
MSDVDDSHSFSMETKAKSQSAGFLEREHTADWELEVWAQDMAGLFEQAAMGMYALCGARLAAATGLSRTFDIQADSPEGLLVHFLSDLLYLAEHDAVGFTAFHIEVEGIRLKATAEEAPLTTIAKEIKAVTFHNLEIKRGDGGLEARIVFDV